MVLRAPEGMPFEPIDPSGYEMGFMKLAVLLLFTTAARGSEIIALTVKNMEFSAND